MTLENRYAVINAEIKLTCTISQLQNTVPVQWKDKDGQVISNDNHYTVNQGSKDENGNQYSTLTISTTKLQALGSTTVTFTCQILSEDDKVAITKTMTLTLYDFSKFNESSIYKSSEITHDLQWTMSDEILLFIKRGHIYIYVSVCPIWRLTPLLELSLRYNL